MAGTAALQGSPNIQLEKTLGADSTQFVQVPLDVAMQYYCRAKRTAGALPPARRLQWLQAKDVDERSEWVTRFRKLTASLGVVIKEIYAARDANWAVGVQEPQIATTQAAPATASKAAASTNLLTQGKPIGGRPVARTMRDGTQICQAFQHGKGKCMQGVRRCGVVIRGDRVCGLGHAAKDCTGGSAVGSG